MILSLFWAFFKIGLFAFGGGFAVLALIQDAIVIEYAWVGQETFLDMVALSQMTPGPIAVNAATLIGHHVGGVGGAVAATLGVISPSILIVSLLIQITQKYKDTQVLKKIMGAIRPASLGLIFSAAFLLGKTALISWQGILIALVAAMLSYFKGISPLLILAGAFVVGLLLF